MAYQNFYATRTSTDIGSGDTTITVDAAPTATSGRVVLEARNPTQREIVSYAGVSGNQLTGVVRGLGGTAAKAHIKGALVEMNLTAEDLEDALGVPNDIATRFSELFSDSVVKGTGVVAVVSGLTASTSDIIFYIGGNRYTQNGIANKTFTASKDTYCRINNNGVVSYDEVTNGGAMPVLPAHNIYFAKVVTDGSSISSIVQMSVGAVGQDTLAPSAVTAEKVDFSTFKQPNGEQGSSSASTSTSYGNLSSAVSVTVDVPASGKVAVFMSARVYNTTTADTTMFVTFAASGANTITGSDSNAASVKIIAGNADISIGRCRFVTGLTPGSTTFRLQRRVTGGNLQIINADLIVIPIEG